MKNWLILLLIFITGCSSQQDEKSYAEDMMISDKCSKACWLGIEPGMTLGREAIYNILSNHYGSENVYYSENGAGVGWYISSSPVFLESGSIYIIGTEHIESIQIILQDNQIPVDDLVSVFDKPEVTTITNPDELQITIPCSLRSLLYPQIGLDVIVDGAMENGYVGMIYITKPFSVNKEIFQGKSADNEMVINWDERGNYCRNTTPSSP